MNSVLRDLGTRIAAVPVPPPDMAALRADGEARLRRRRRLTRSAFVAVTVLVVGVAVWQLPEGRREAGPPAGHDRRQHVTREVRTATGARPVTYAAGTTIHWGATVVDVGAVTRGRLVRENGLDDLDVTDDGVVFVTGPVPGRFQVDVAESTVWVTDGGPPVAIGTTIGNAYHGFQVIAADEGSTLVWRDGRGDRDGALVVYDTHGRRELGRLGDGRAVLLAVLADAVYWTHDTAACAIEADFGCLRWVTVRRFDISDRSETDVSWDAFEAERRSRPGVLIGRYDGDAPVNGLVDYRDLAFDRYDDRLVSDSRGVDVRPRVPGSGAPLQLRVPSNERADRFALVQWLDADRVVLIGYRGDSGTELNDAGDLLTCQLTTGVCEIAVRSREPLAVPMAD